MYMSKPGLFLLSICAGIVIGLLLGYTFFHGAGAKPPSASTDPIDTSRANEYFYRLSDSLAARHTVSGSESGVAHHVDTVAIETK